MGELLISKMASAEMRSRGLGIVVVIIHEGLGWSVSMSDLAGTVSVGESLFWDAFVLQDGVEGFSSQH